jgi:energy-coupling factor transport system substrate-specific component
VAQIIAVADTFDAMYSNRPYRPRMNFDKVVEIIRGAAGTQLTPDVVDAFLRLAEQGKLRAKNDTEGSGSFEEIDNLNRGSQSEKQDKTE